MARKASPQAKSAADLTKFPHFQDEWLRDEQVIVGDYRFDPAKKEVSGRACDVILVFYGYEPQAQWLKGLGVGFDEKNVVDWKQKLAGLYPKTWT